HGPDMSITRWLSGAVCAIGLVGLGFVASPSQEKKAVPKEAPKVAAPAAVLIPLDPQRGLVNDAQVQQWEQHYGPQLRQLLRTELHFMRMVTQPTKQQYEKIAADTEPAIREAVRSLLVAQNTGN